MQVANLIVDLQFGSTGKGLFAGYLARKTNPDTIVTAWGPNAGHTYVDAVGKKFVTIALPSGLFAAEGLQRILLGPGSVINPAILQAEMEAYREHLAGVEVLVHAHAAVVTERHREAESRYGFGIGSTMKGVGEAVIQKLRRDRADMNIATWSPELNHMPGVTILEPSEYAEALGLARVCQIEGAQGFSLGINSGFYPYTTSRECSKWQVLNDCGLPGNLGCPLSVYGVARTYPIRVANRFDDKGKMIGWSGPHYPDQEEIRWEQIGVAPELTTVTKLPRRIFTFSEQQIREAVRANGNVQVFLNFCNYLQPAPIDFLCRDDADHVWPIIQSINRIPGALVCWTGWGPKDSDIREVA